MHISRQAFIWICYRRENIWLLLYVICGSLCGWYSYRLIFNQYITITIRASSNQYQNNTTPT